MYILYKEDFSELFLIYLCIGTKKIPQRVNPQKRETGNFRWLRKKG